MDNGLECLDCFNFKCIYEGYPGGYSGPPEPPEGFCKYGLGLYHGFYNYGNICNEFIGCRGLREDMENQFIVRGYEWAMSLVKSIVSHKTGLEITKVEFNKHGKEDIAVFHLGYDPSNKNNGFHFVEKGVVEELYEGLKLEEIHQYIDKSNNFEYYIKIRVGITLWDIHDQRWIKYGDNYCNLEIRGR